MGTKATQGKIQHLFDLFAQNWTLVKQHPNLHVTPDIPDSFLCPVCFRGFTRDVLATPDILTLEHVPPKKLGGINKDCTLTCRVCNNTTGILEGRLREQLVAEEVLAGLEGTSIDGEYCTVVEGQEIWLPATLENTPTGWNIIGHPHRTAPSLLQQVSNDEFAEKLTGITFRYKGKRGSTAIALLKIAYLFAFRVLGYAVLIYPAMQQVRMQIYEPTSQHLPSGWIVDWLFPDTLLGINAVVEPANWRSFLVVFDLDSGREKHRFGIVLPGPGDPGLDIYQQLSREACPQLKLRHLQSNTALLTDPALCFYAYHLWG